MLFLFVENELWISWVVENYFVVVCNIWVEFVLIKNMVLVMIYLESLYGCYV